jgi:hypothetical protein
LVANGALSLPHPVANKTNRTLTPALTTHSHLNLPRELAPIPPTRFSDDN